MGRACLSPPVDCYDGRIVAYTAGSGPDAGLADRMPVKAADATAGGPDGWIPWTDRYGPGAVDGRQRLFCSPDSAAAEGFFGRMRTESVHPDHWGVRTRSEALVPVDDCIRWHDHERIKRSLGWMSPVQYRQSRGMAA